STVLSAVGSRVTVAVALPAANVTVPVVAVKLAAPLWVKSVLNVAVPPTEKFTVSVPLVTPARVNVYTRFVPPSSATAVGETATLTSVSSLVIVPVAGLPAGLYPVPEVTVRTTVSFGSTVVSAVGSMVTVAVVAPAANDTVPVVAAKVAAPVWV